MDGLTSIIILVQDRFELFERCLLSILQHTRSPFEIIFIDQNTKDPRIRSLIFDYFENQGKRGIWVRNDYNNGVTPGRNQGILLARGDYLLFFDDDAYVSEELHRLPDDERGLDWLGRLKKWFALPNVGIVGQTGSYIIPERPGVFWEAKGRGVECDVIQGYCFMFSREVVNRIGILDPAFGRFWHEESEYALRAKAAGFKVIRSDYIGVTHYGSGSGDDGSYHQKIVYMFNKWKDKFPEILVPREKWE